jgi:hypothetical protein
VMGGTGLEPVTPSLSSQTRGRTEADELRQAEEGSQFLVKGVAIVGHVSTDGADTMLTPAS